MSHSFQEAMQDADRSPDRNGFRARERRKLEPMRAPLRDDSDDPP